MDMTISSDSVTLTLNPASNAFSSRGLIISVGTNNPGGYRLFMSTTDGSTSLVKSDDSTKTIETLPSNGSTGYTTDTFVADRWGYKVGSANYFPFVSGSMINSSDTAVNNHTTNLTFGAKASYEKPSGTYNTTLGFSTLPKVTTTNMQDSNVAEVCTEEPTMVTDSRDGNLYMIRRLADGNCWMLDNLRLDPTAVSLDTLKGKTNASDQTLTYFKNGGGTGQYPASRVSDAWTSADQNSYNLPYINADSKNTTVTSYGDGSGKVGVYYNYCAASAGSYCYTSGSGNATEDICPAGWKMPTGGASGQYQGLADVYTDATATNTNSLQYNLSTPLSGWFYDGSGGGQNSYGYFWSSTQSNAYDMYSLRIDTSSARPQNGDHRRGGRSVRCVLDETPSIDDLTTMQEFYNLDTDTFATVVDGMVEEQAYELKDNRDNEVYKIAKLKDGNVWMLDNMRLDLTAVSLATLQGNTNATDQTLTYLKNGGGSLPNTNYAVTNWASSDYYDRPLVKTNYKDTVTTSYGNGSGKIGVYYNYCAASAGSYCYGSYGGSSNTSQDICPAGWKMPNGNTGRSSYYYLYSNNTKGYNSDVTSFRDALSVTLPGYYTAASTAVNQGSEGYFWSSDFSSAGNMLILYANSSTVNPQFNESRYRGHSVRCIVKHPIENMTMQEIGNLSSADKTILFSSITTGQAYNTSDNRDGEPYKIAKLADGNVWLLDNLRLDLSEVSENVLKGNTNATDQSINCLKNNNGTGCSNPYTTTAVQSKTYSGGAWTDSYDKPYIGTGYKDTTTTGYGDGYGKIGVYYNYCAASAGSYCYPDNGNSDDSTQDVCPSGWKMPKGDAAKDSYYYLYNNGYSNNAANFRDAFSALFSGYMRSGSVSDQGTGGYFWSSSYQYEGYYMYNLYLTSSTVRPQNRSSRQLGVSVRCILSNN